MRSLCILLLIFISCASSQAKFNEEDYNIWVDRTIKIKNDKVTIYFVGTIPQNNVRDFLSYTIDFKNKSYAQRLPTRGPNFIIYKNVRNKMLYLDERTHKYKLDPNIKIAWGENSAQIYYKNKLSQTFSITDSEFSYEILNYRYGANSYKKLKLIYALDSSYMFYDRDDVLLDFRLIKANNKKISASKYYKVIEKELRYSKKAIAEAKNFASRVCNSKIKQNLSITRKPTMIKKTYRVAYTVDERKLHDKCRTVLYMIFADQEN